MNIEKSQTFEERVYEKIRTDIGALMGDDELKKLVETAIERMFFKDRITPGNSWDKPTVKPPLIQEVVQAAVEKQIDHHVKIYVAQHSDLMNSLMRKTLEEGMLKVAIRTFTELTAPAIINLQGQVSSAIFSLQQAGIYK